MGVYKYVYKGLIVLVFEEIGVWVKLSLEFKFKLVLCLFFWKLFLVF